MLTGIGAYAGYKADPPAGVSLALAMLNPKWAVKYRQANPTGYLVLRPDVGDDPAQLDYNAVDPVAEARRFVAYFVEPAYCQVPPYTYNAILGPCECWPGPDQLDFRAAVELAICSYVQDVLRVAYVALSCPVGNLAAIELAHFAPVIRKARWISYHAYLAPGVTRLELEPGPWHFWRPTRLWLPELRRLGLPLRLLCTELGTYAREPSMSATALAQLDVALALSLAAECAGLGVEFGGALPFGFGLQDGMAKWNLDGNERLFVGGAPVPEGYSVGQGILDAMHSNDDTPASSEMYLGADWSFAVGRKGAYVYSKSANFVSFVPPTGGMGSNLAALTAELTGLAAELKAAVAGRG